MKIIFEKKLENGKYFVRINISQYSAEEIDKIQRFGAPRISIEPKAIYTSGTGWVRVLPLHNLNHDFEFPTEGEAVAFVNVMGERIKAGIQTLKNKKDSFSGSAELEL